MKALNYLLGAYIILLILIIAIYSVHETLFSPITEYNDHGYVVKYSDGSSICVVNDRYHNMSEVVYRCLRR